MNQDLDLLRQGIEQERAARQDEEAMVKQTALDLYQINRTLRHLNEDLEQAVEMRTQALKTEQMRLRALISNLDSGILLEDENRTIVLANHYFCKIFGIPLSPEALEGADCSQSAEQSKHLFADPEGFVNGIKALLDERQVRSEEILHLADGRIFNRTFIPVFFNENYLGHLWKYRDVTAEHRAVEALRNSEEKYRGIIENMELGLLEVDNQEIIVRAYPRFCEMVGYAEHELIGRSADKVFIAPEFLPVMVAQSRERAAGKAGVYEIQIFKKGGERIWVLISGAPILDSKDKVVGSMGIHYDITEQKNLQRDLEDARQRAEAAQEAEKQFLANMSHEIRTPLNAIIGMSHLLYDTQPTEEQHEYLDILRNSAEMLRTLISDVLDLSKIRAGRFEVQEQAFDLGGIVRSLVKNAQLRLEDKPVVVESFIDPAIQNLVIGDDLLLHQVLSNLLGNAEKFTEQGKITVSIRREMPIATPDDSRSFYKIEVTDTGIGIAPEKQALIFQTFRQVDGDIKRRYGGTGLGLAITKQLVELQGGFIQVLSEPGKGSTFVVRLPYRDTSTPVSAQKAPAVAPPPLHEGEKHILVVEDNHMNRKYIGALLSKWNITPIFAHNGREGVEMARQKPFDLILMDIQMPEMDGYEATIALRQSINPNTDTPIIALTASALISQKDRAFSAGMNDYLSKPFKPDQLLEKIERFCPPKELQSTLTDPLMPFHFQYHPRLHGPTLHNLYGDDLEYALEMFDTFDKYVRLEFERLRPLLESKQTEALFQLAHKIRPTFGMVGAPELEQMMQTLELAARENPPDYDALETLLNQLEKEIPQVINAVHADLNKLQHYG